LFYHEPGDNRRYIVEYRDIRQKSKKESLAYCYGYVYDDLEVGKTYIVLKKFKRIKQVYEKIKH
jgi:hypothetical protein